MDACLYAIALKNADALVICTEWSQFKAPDFDAIAEQLNNKVLIVSRVSTGC